MFRAADWFCALMAASTTALKSSSENRLAVRRHPCDGPEGPSHGAQYGFDLPEHESKPVQERVALILRGESFHQRYERGCVDSMRAAQVLAWQSLMDNIVIALERENTSVDMFITDHTGCKLFDAELAVFSQRALNRNVRIKKLDAPTQTLNIRAALEWFKQEVGGLGAIQTDYSLVILTRHDLIWLKPFGSWPTANTSNFNFLSKVGLDKPNGDFKVSDIFHMMPGHAFPAFDWAVGEGYCFNPDFDASDSTNAGHACMCQMSQAIGSAHISFVTPWRPPNNIRETSDVVEWIKPYMH